MGFLTTLPGIIGIIVGLGGILTVVILYIKGLIKKGSNQEDDRLITILQGTVNALQTKVDDYSAQYQEMIKQMEALKKEVHELKADNEKYILILQGRDAETKEFYKRAYTAMDLVSQSHDILTTVAESSRTTNDAMQKLIEIVGRVVTK